jgi:predicted protein tyrosine phosphatase
MLPTTTKTMKPPLAIVSTSRANLRNHLTATAAVVTFAGKGTRESHAKLPRTMPRLRITANDIELSGQSYAPGGGVLFSDRHARRILAFASALAPSVDTLIVQCRGGHSRSVAVVAAMRVLRGEPEPKSLSNRHIFETVLRVARDRVVEPSRSLVPGNSSSVELGRP